MLFLLLLFQPKLRYRNFEIPSVVKNFIADVSAFLSPTQLILHIKDVEEDPVVNYPFIYLFGTLITTFCLFVPLLWSSL